MLTWMMAPCCLRGRILQRLLVLGLLSTPLSQSRATEADNVWFHGALVAEPCVVMVGDDDQEVQFGSIPDKYLYAHERTLGLPLTVHLQACDTSIAKTVKLTFSSTEESSALPGLLAVTGSSGSKGIAIGLETQEGENLPFNHTSKNWLLKDGDTTLTLKAYVRAEPQAITDRTIARGDFSAVATFNLEYE